MSETQATSLGVFTSIAMSTLAILTTVAGAAISSSSKVNSYSNPDVLMAIGLSISSGASITLSLHVLTQTSLNSFMMSGQSKTQSFLYLAIALSLGVLLILSIERASTFILENYFPVKSEEEEIEEGEEKTPKRSIPTLEPQNEYCNPSPKKTGAYQGSCATIELQNSSKLRQLVYVTCTIIFLSTIPQGALIYIASTKKILIPYEVNLLLIMIYVIVVNFPFGVVIGLLASQYTRRNKSVWYALVSSSGQVFGFLIGCLFLGSTSEFLKGFIRGINAGAFLCFALREMLPTARFVDPFDKFVSSSALATMVLIRLITACSQYAI